MRNECVRIIEERLKLESSVDSYFLTGDLGFSVLEKISNFLGNKFLNVGIAEANMMSIAAALAFEGQKVFTYSIVPFTSFRCLEQIRNDICYHNCDVTIIGIGVGYGYGYLGPSHHAIDDARVMTSITNLNVYSPNDCRELAVIMNEIFSIKKPKYLRLGKGGEGVAVLPVPDYIDGAFIYGSKRPKLSIFIIGTILNEVEKSLPQESIETGIINIISVARLKPFPDMKLFDDFLGTKVILIQELTPDAGFADKLYSDLVKIKQQYVDFKVISASNEFASEVGSMQYLRKKSGLSSDTISKQVEEFLN